MVKCLAYKFRFYPTESQKVILAQTFGCVRVVYNNVLKMSTDSWYDEQKRVNYNQTSKYLTNLKKNNDYVWLNNVSCVPLQQSLRHLQTAFTNFFEKRSGYPTFKNKHGKQSATFTSYAFKWDSANHQLKLGKGIGKLKIKWSRKVRTAPTTITITKDQSDRYFVSMRIMKDIKPLEPIDKEVGLDAGLTHMVITSDGQKFGNPKYLNKNLKKLAKLQQRLSKKQKGNKKEGIKASANHEKARLKLAKLHAKISDSRRDYIHKLTTQLVRDNQAIYVEDLCVRGMIKNKKLSRHIADVSWGELFRQLEYKCDWYGRTFGKIDRFYPSSKRCNCCGHVVKELKLSIRKWQCPECSVEHDRDINAAINILGAGQALTVCGENVRPIRTSVRCRQSSVKQKPPILV